jgi:2-polyprenyl-3-methyl-5-hydroxy-6-metoxy-1,4-benzoquinol methylase
MSTPSIDEQKSFYDNRWKVSAKRPYVYQHLKNRIYAIRKLLAKTNISQPRILEIGCGLGVISNELSKFGTVEALDLSSEAVSIAQRMYPHVKYLQADVFKYDFGDVTYDVIVTSEVIEHIPLESRDRFIKILWEHLKINGWLVLTTPNKSVSDKLIKDQPVENHFYHNDLRELLSPYFNIENFSTVQNFLPVLCHRSRFFQIMRFFVYDILKLRNILENPMNNNCNGLYFVVLGQRSDL